MVARERQRPTCAHPGVREGLIIAASASSTAFLADDNDALTDLTGLGSLRSVGHLFICEWSIYVPAR